MGVPKFYRWTSERYPCLSQVVREHQIPEFDNLYLDMNGIIHVCSHPNDNDPHFRISEADIFKNIFHYIEVLFRIIKPQKNFFMAVDGVAPRAKMNQQRGRRFRTAKETEDNIKRAVQKGERLPEEDQFDSNCITPGTDFMARLNNHLQYFVNLKVSTDPLWQNCNIYLSGHDVPGEGEHKIMDFIRHQKSNDDYDPNTRHCLYGLDADLIVLGLVSHEPHFSLLREEVRFGKQSKRVTKPEETVFHLLHLSLMREYLDFEFGSLKDALPFEYDLERIIDDWVLLGFLVGNDFVPHLPNMHINHDALPTLYKVYIETMPKLDGYLHDGGYLNLARFQKYLTALSQFDRDRFEDLYADMKWLEGKTGRAVSQGKMKKEKKGLKFSQLVSQVDDDIMFPVRNPFMALADLPDTGDNTAKDDSRKELETKNSDELEALFGGLGFKDGEGGEELFELELKQNKRAYYIDKFEEPTADEDFVASVAYEYILALQWILHYYFNGVQSWSWYYPFHYSPYVSDLINIETFDLKLDKGTPFRPFEQLLAVLPAYSRRLLPQAFQSLMVMDSSPIIDYYPSTFKTDLNGKQQDWEAVVLIPFIKEERLLAAMEPHYSRLTDEEKVRNSYGSCLKYRFSKDLNFKFASTYPGVFADIDVCRASCTKIGMDEFRIDIKDIKKGLCTNVLQDVYFPGFPTFRHIQHDTQLRKVGIRVFSYASKSNSLVLSIRKPGEKIGAETVKEMVGKVVHIEWPYMVEGLVTAISDKEKRFIYQQEERVVKEEKMTDVKMKDVQFWMDNVHKKYIERKGIDPGEIDVLVEAKLLKGTRYICGPKGKVTLEKEWADTHQFYPLQAVVQDLKVHKSVAGADTDSLEELFNVGSRCFMMASPHYGCSGEVLEVDKDASRVRVSLSVPKEPDLSSVIVNKTKLCDSYYSIESTARKVGLSTRLLLKTVGNLMVNRSKKTGDIDPGSKVNIGLKLKLSGRNREVLGYARREETGWSLSENAIDVLRAYIQRFPKLFEKLSTLPDQEWYSKSDLFPDKNRDGSLEVVVEYLKSLPYRQIDPVKCGGRFLDKNIISAIMDAVEEVKKLKEEPKSVKVKVKPHVLFKATQQFGNLVPDPSVDYLLFDRVVNVRDNLAVPLGYRGTVVGVHEVRLDEKDEHSPTELNYEVVFDEEFLGGLKLRCEESRGAYMTNSSMLNLSFGSRKESKKKGISPDRITKLQEKAEPKQFFGTTPQSSSSRYSSEFTPPRSKSYSRDNTPTGRPKDEIYSRYSGSGSKQRFNASLQNSSMGTDDDLKTPDYWMRSYRREPRDRSTPNSSRSYHSPSPRIKNDSRTPKSEKSEGDISYQDMWMKLYDSDGSQKTPSSYKRESDTRDNAEEKIVQDSEPVVSSKSVDKEGTALLQKLLHINIPRQQQQHLEKEPQKEAESSEPPLVISGDSQREDMSQNIGSPLMNILFEQGSAPPQPMVATPASPPSPFVQGSPIPPTKRLQNWCFQNNMPSPTYTYSSTPQGVNAVVNVDSIFRCGGLMCKTKEEALESAALVALKNLLRMQAKVQIPIMPVHSQTNWSTFGMGHRPSFASQFPQKSSSPHSQRWVSPDRFVGGARLRMQYIESDTGPLRRTHRMIGQQQQQQQQNFQQIGPQFPHMVPSLQHVTEIRHQSIPHLQRPLNWEHKPMAPMIFDPVAHHLPSQVIRPPNEMSPVAKSQGALSDGKSVLSSGRNQAKRLTDEEDYISGRSSVEKKTIEKGSTVKNESPAFVPLQVNRANLAMGMKSDDRKKEADSMIGSTRKQDEMLDLIDLNVAVDDDASDTEDENSVSINVGTDATNIIDRDEKLKDHESTEIKPRKEKPKRTILLAPSFFAAKKE